MKQKLIDNWKLFLIASLTLGLAPFNPPHIWGKIQWILGLLLISAILNLLSKLAKTDQE